MRTFLNFLPHFSGVISSNSTSSPNKASQIVIQASSHVTHTITRRLLIYCTVDAIIADMHEVLGRPPIMLLDNWPVVAPMVVIASHEVAEQVSKPSKYFPQYSAPKSPSVDHIISLIGPNSILFKQVNNSPAQSFRSFLLTRLLIDT